MPLNPKVIATLVSVALFPLSLILFASGFFPHKPFLPGLATFNGDGERPPAAFDKVIFMVVDALRSDFVYSNYSGFEFTQELIRNGNALPFTAHASSPTITMPRVKAITTGSVPSFLDVILNFAESDTSSTLANQDTWLAQIRTRPGGRLVMYGDDTWLKLFPGMFYRHDGTSSFFVSDFVEVDNNVTRHIPEELQNDDWSAMIMHYLGLDHIGHKAGPYSPYMVPKQREMDSIVKKIYTAMEEKAHLSSTVLVLCGDHGMTDAGNHGGASPGETSPALTFISPKFRHFHKGNDCPTIPSEDLNYYHLVEQSDIAPTLAGLLGFPVSLNNLGVFIPEFLSLWPQDTRRLNLLYSNAEQILNVVKETFPKFNTRSDLYCDTRNSSADLTSLECRWQKASQLVQQSKSDRSFLAEAELSLIEFSRAAQTIMSNAASNYILARLYYGTVIAAAAVFLCIILCCDPLLLNRASGAIQYFILAIAGYFALMFASSYVEEEQQFWYWILTGWTGYLYIKTKAEGRFEFKSALIFGALSRIVRRWNQTGQKFTTEPDIAKTFFTEYPNILWILALLTYTDIYQRLRVPGSRERLNISTALYLPLTSFAFIFKAAFTSADAPELIRYTPVLDSIVKSVRGFTLLLQARVIFLGLTVALIYNVYQKRKAAKKANSGEQTDYASAFHSILSLFLLTQSRATNIPLFGIFQLQYDFLSSMDLSSVEISITSLILQYTSFFAFGGSNAISSVDLSNAYNGVSSYNVVLVGILTFVGNWAGSIWWVSATYCMIREKGQKKKQKQQDVHIQLWTLFTATSLLAVMVACTILRAHLFIWTVFSPKFLYSAAWALGQHVGVNILLGDGLMRWLYN
ncbi:major facilitator super transporter protein [Ophidiomyces ophidiicola]|nr:major facilitator super transporter protein [Ophidiomyces ophidiicola]KAI1957612.1 major facilitator super transporter protein [Ophidiomyces ophidiicola]KAI1971293.1 major facilitator super transporter protein [Ophidiomyces ophidiicola]KAI2006262.1 major facilitator super transporter protein [Ophidiomyces ophidiicola]KAI2024567.1 major facilitator super transporter protein [Ophidiomyces ophidiicola]